MQSWWYVHIRMVGKGTSILAYTHSLYCVHNGMLNLANQNTQQPTAASAVRITKPQLDCSQSQLKDWTAFCTH